MKSTNTMLDKKPKVDITIIHLIANLGENDLITTRVLKIMEIQISR